ncbi:MAG: hypothetical protein AABW90_03625 [Nanoarchaeota archaeon]
MLETIDPMSLEDMEKVLKHLPEPTSLEVTLNNFDYSDVHTQASKIAERLEIKLDKIGYRSIKTSVLEPSKEKILRIYECDREKDSREIRMSDENYPKLIIFKKAEWNLKNLDIQLNPFNVLVKYTRDTPDYIQKMKEELKDTFVDYKIEQTRTIY